MQIKDLVDLFCFEIMKVIIIRYELGLLEDMFRPDLKVFGEVLLVLDASLVCNTLLML